MLRSGRGGLTPPPFTVSLTVKYPFFFDGFPKLSGENDGEKEDNEFVDLCASSNRAAAGASCHLSPTKVADHHKVHFLFYLRDGAGDDEDGEYPGDGNYYARCR